MEIPIANIYYLLCYAWDVLEERDALAPVDAIDSTDLRALFAKVLVNGTRRLLRRGLDRGYLPQEGEIPGVRGRLQVGPTMRRSLLRQGRAVCVWDELEYDTPPNRILKATFGRLRDEPSLNEDTRSDVRDILRWLEPVQFVELRAEHFRRVQLHRNNRIYAFLLTICQFLHESWLPDERGGTRSFRDFVREKMAALFEEFVRNFYRRELGRVGWNVSASHIKWQTTDRNADALEFLPVMKTDVCLQRGTDAVILDTKFYASALKTNQHGSAKLASANLYQLYTYLRQKAHEPGWERATGVLLYPQTTRDFRAEFETHGHRIRALSLDLTAPWRAIHAALLGAVSIAAVDFL